MKKPIITERDISWLSFNHRILQEAQNSQVPLYERIKFLAIYSSNLDEFFRVRVSAMRSFKDMKKKVQKKLSEIPSKKILKKIKGIDKKQQNLFKRTETDSIRSQIAIYDYLAKHK